MLCVCSEPTVRSELMEQVPNIAMFLHESRPNFPAAFSRYLVPIVVRYLTDPNNQVGIIIITSLLGCNHTHKTPFGEAFKVTVWCVFNTNVQMIFVHFDQH